MDRRKRMSRWEVFGRFTIGVIWSLCMMFVLQSIGNNANNVSEVWLVICAFVVGVVWLAGAALIATFTEE